MLLHQQLGVSADVSAIVTSESTSTGAGNGLECQLGLLDGLLDSSIKHHKTYLKHPSFDGCFLFYYNIFFIFTKQN
jgi:hypothetical protein